jgi:hypothetical protein
MNVLFISGAHLSRPLAYEAGILKKILNIFMGVIQNRQKFLDKVGFGNDFDGRLLDEEAAGYVFWFEQRSIDEIIVGLHHFGDRRSADYLEDWKRGPGDELEGHIQTVLRDERLAAFGKLVDLLLRLNPDKKPPTIPLDDWFIWILDRRYLGRWWANCRDDLGLDDRAVYKSEGEPAGEPTTEPDQDRPQKTRTGRTTRSRGARRHGRPPDSQGPSTIPPPSAITFKDSTTLSVGVSGHSAAGDTVTGTFISALAVDSTPGPATSTATLDESSKPPALSAPKPF